MAINPNDIKFYLTSSGVDQTQEDVHLSIGGSVSSTEVSLSASLTAIIDGGSTSAAIDNSNFSESDFLQVNHEILSVEDYTSSLVSFDKRGELGTSINYLSSDSSVYNLVPNSVLTGRFGKNLKQYRCLAIKNTSSDETAFEVSIYIKLGSRNDNSSFEIAIEQPQNDFISGVATDGSSTTITDSVLSGFPDNHFSGSTLRILDGSNAGQKVKILSYDQATNKFIFTTSLPAEIANGTSYSVDPSPSSQSVTSIISPLDSPLRSSFLSPLASSDAVSINVLGRDHSDDLKPGDVVYVWIKRTIVSNVESFDNNRSIIGIRYKESS